jgi:uncharacterized repeat protein (TIGR03803 family)
MFSTTDRGLQGGTAEMRSLGISRDVLSISVATALLSACGILPLSPSKGQDDVQPPIGAPGAVPQGKRPTPSYRVLYRFDRHPNGQSPLAGLIGMDGKLYGTTELGGVTGVSGCNKRIGCGTVYSITPSGTVASLFSFNREHGVDPQSNLIDVNGTLYGTTTGGGSSSLKGTVYSVTANGNEQVLHTFGGGSDGWLPDANLIDMKGTLYGTTLYGGGARSQCLNLCGTVFSISTSGAEKVLYRFKGGAGEDGAYPGAALIDVNGTLYGTTSGGGGYHLGHGTVYSITEKGVEKVVFRFTGGSDGAYPVAPLLDVNGTLYGTTWRGGSSDAGTVYSVTTNGAEKVLYSFTGGSDGGQPVAGLVDVAGTLYGTTSAGGSSNAGAVYSVTTSGTEKVLYSFAGGSDGANPQAPLIDVKGALYGTTAQGGGVPRCPKGCGTVFTLVP